MARTPRTRDRYNRGEALAGYLFISPWIIGFLVFTGGAMIYSLYISFSSYNLATNTARPIGIDNYANLFDAFGDQNQFVAKQVGSQVNAQWYPNVLSPYADQIQLEAVPFLNSDGEPFSVASGTAFVIPVGAKNPAAACAWMVNLTSGDAWMAAGDARAKTIEEEGGINTGLFTGSPSADQAIREKFVTESGNAGFDQVISTFYDVVDYGKSFGSSPAGQEIQNELNNAITAALLGDKTTEQALADAQQAAQRAYDNATAG